MATDRRKRNGEEQTPDWHRITAWSKLAEICSQYLHKGERVMIEGRIEYGSYEKDGVKHYSTDIIAENMEMLGSRNDHEPRESIKPWEQREQVSPVGAIEDDIPF